MSHEAEEKEAELCAYLHKENGGTFLKEDFSRKSNVMMTIPISREIMHEPEKKEVDSQADLREEMEMMTISIPEKMRHTFEEKEIESSRHLPEDLVKTIIAKLPFPSLLKAQVLSKSWQAKFTNVSPEAVAFQSQVAANSASRGTYAPNLINAANSASWGTYAPNLINWSNRTLLALDDGKSKSHWFANLPAIAWQDVWSQHERVYESPQVWLAGALVLLGGLDTEHTEYSPQMSTTTFVVSNLVTGSCRELTLPAHLGYTRDETVRGPSCLIPVGCHSYKVLSVFTFSLGDEYYRFPHYRPVLLVCLYDSNSHLWTSTLHKYNDIKVLNGLNYFLDKDCAHMDGKVYFLALYEGYTIRGMRNVKLISYEVENTSWKIENEVNKLGNTTRGDGGRPHFGIFCCGDKIIVVVMSAKALMLKDCRERSSVKEFVQEELWGGKIHEKSIQVFQLDMQSSELVSISDGNPEMKFPTKKFEYFEAKFSADIDFLYFGWDCVPTTMIKFDLKSREWSLAPLVNSSPDFCWKRHKLDWIHGCFEPGLNPFVSA